MILLDTSVLSELMRPAPSAAVEGWMGARPAASIFISAIAEAELRYGLALLPEGRRQRQLVAQAEAMPAEDFGAVSCPSTVRRLPPTLALPLPAGSPVVRSPRRMHRSRRSRRHAGLRSRREKSLILPTVESTWLIPGTM
jgi:PIN domain-containing protein